MSQSPPILSLQEEDLKKMLACAVHTGSTNLSSGMERYVHGRNPESGNHIIDLRKTWEKLVLAARIIAAVENPKDVCVVGLTQGTPIAQRAVLKFGKHTGAQTFAGRFTPGTLTNQIQSQYVEPTVLVLSDPIKDHQPLMESSYMNIPVIAFCNTNVHLRNIDIAIPCNTEGPNSIALMFWMLAREVLRLQGKVPRDREWGEMVDMFIYKDQDEQDKAEEERKDSGFQKWGSTDVGAADWDTAVTAGDEGALAGDGTDWATNTWVGAADQSVWPEGNEVPVAAGTPDEW
jgi:small subunit ribosomal protein SAe